MHGYGWVTRGGIYAVLEARWCKISTFRSGHGVPAGWGAWQRIDALSTARIDSTQFTPVELTEVKPADFVQIIGPDSWARTTVVNTVLEVELLEPAPTRDDPGDILVASHEAAWIIYADRIEVLCPDGQREVRDTVSPPQGTKRMRIVREVQSDLVTWTDMRE